MTKRFIVGSCVAAAGGCVGVGAIIKASLTSSDSLEDGAVEDKDDDNGQTELISEVMSHDSNTQYSHSLQTSPGIQADEPTEVTDDEVIEEDSDEVDVYVPSSEESRNHIPESVGSSDNPLEEKDEAGDKSGLTEKSSAVTYTITGKYPKLKETCEGCSVEDFKGLLYFLTSDNDNWDDFMTDLEKARNYKNNQYVSIDNSFVARDSAYDSKTWDDLISEYNDWLQKWEQKMQSSNGEQNQWQQLRDQNLNTFQMKERYQNLFKELT